MLTVDKKTLKGLDKYFKEISLVDCLYGNAMDAYFTNKIFHKLKGLLEEKGQLSPLYDKLIQPVAEIFAEIEYNGMEIEEENLVELEAQLKRKLFDMEDEIYAFKEVPGDCNINSSEDIVDILIL